MISISFLGNISTPGTVIFCSGLLILGGLAVMGTMVYVATRALRAAYTQQARRFSHCRLTGRQAVGQLLRHVGLSSDGIDDGAKIDHYDQLRRRVRLRTESSVSSSVAALAIAAHEVGHAEQFAKGYWAAHATRCLLVLLVFGAVVVLVYPFATTISGAGDVNLTGLLALAVLFALLRLPVTIALERDANRRAERLLNETKLAHQTEQQGITHFLRAALRVHVAFSLALVLLIGAGVAAMWLVEIGLDRPALTGIEVAPQSNPAAGPHEALLETHGPLTPITATHPAARYAYPLAVFTVAVATVWWAFFGKARKAPARSAIEANNEGMARFQAGDSVGAIALIDEALRQNPGLAAAHYNRAIVLASQGRSPEALASIEAVFASDPKEAEPLLCNADAWYLRGTFRLDQGDYQGAVDDLSRALELDPAEPATLLCNRGLAWIRLGQLDRAHKDTEMAIALAPEDAIAYSNRGFIHLQQGNLEQAESDLRHAIAIDPQLPNPHEHLSKLLGAKATVP